MKQNLPLYGDKIYFEKYHSFIRSRARKCNIHVKYVSVGTDAASAMRDLEGETRVRG